MIKKLKYQGDPILTTPTKTVQTITEDIRQLVLDMSETMAYNDGIGLASTQVGSDLSIAVIDTLDKFREGQFLIMINPEILAAEGEFTHKEECLSCPGVRIKHTRPTKVLVKYMNIEGNIVTKELLGMTAVCAAHEIDHLNGVLITSEK